MKQEASFENCCLADKEMDGLVCEKLNFTKSQFDRARLRKATIKGGYFSRASFIGADLSGSKLTGVIADDANFTDANLKTSKLHKSSLRNAVFTNADVQGCDFKECDLRGADLSQSNAAQALGFSKAKYDELTKLPAQFPHWQDMEWTGKGPNPYKVAALNQTTSANQTSTTKSLDFAGFFKILEREFDRSRLDKALGMLKDDRFQLFSDHNDEGFVGVIKSQTDAELFYACRLGCDGTFACCTQNLNPCGGLRGGLCKHLLVLTIGLGKAGVLDTARTAMWVEASKKEKPRLDKETMAELFLRYKGAQSGEVDWRPTETIPEDYYTL